ncbi:serine/threonine dehydratase [Glaciecola punicea]|jgi:threonine dehydratase|uniref:serine/threonine dehydratase n=1 Tax=Glaciecola punicea TaxID=56804 RepID=UPI0008728E71|nr:serine/threonine dehydratase [Glaciecola punicea]OFA30143.1 serine/threonine dehydratase [Glaciecola punicea]
MTNISFTDISLAHERILHMVQRTPIVQSTLLNTWLGHDIYFKVECLQTTGAFKLRGASNFIAKLAQNNSLPKHIVANSSGNHAQAVAYAAKHFNIPVTIYCTKSISTVKAAATAYYGATLAQFDDRPSADKAVELASKQPGVVWIPPFNHPDIIAGQGTAALEALQQTSDIDAIFVPCGGGGLAAGTLIAAKHIRPNAKVIGVEPLMANDAARSLRAGHIIALDKAPITLADGAATPSVGEHTFKYLKQLDAFYEVDEQQIAYWTQWLQHLLKLHIEPTCAMVMQGVKEYLQNLPKHLSIGNKRQQILVIISGGNISAQSMVAIWQEDHLKYPPSL